MTWQNRVGRNPNTPYIFPTFWSRAQKLTSVYTDSVDGEHTTASGTFMCKISETVITVLSAFDISMTQRKVIQKAFQWAERKPQYFWTNTPPLPPNTRLLSSFYWSGPFRCLKGKAPFCIRSWQNLRVGIFQLQVPGWQNSCSQFSESTASC